MWLRRELANMIIKHEYPLSIVDHSNFRKYSSALQPMFEMPSRNTIKSDILKIFKEEKSKTLSMLEGHEGKIAITTDMWTADHQKKGYMAVTAHYIDIHGPYKNSSYDGLKIIGDGIERIRDNVQFWASTPKRWERFEEAARQLRIPTSKKLSMDVKTRWNSTYLMLQSALNYKDVFPRCVQLHRDNLYKSLPTENDWLMASEICAKLKIFYETTEMFSGTKYATANLYFPNICKIILALNEWVISGNHTLTMMAMNMLEKFEKYWDNVHGIMGVATILDPRYKTSLLEYYFESIYGSNAENEIERIVKICRDLLKEYEMKMVKEDEMGTKASGSNITHSSSGVGGFDESQNLTDYDDYVSRRKKKSKMMSEMDRYLDDDVIPRKPDFDILNWWKTTGPQFPTLQAIVKDIYAIPVSTVASESTFSTGGRLVSPHRSRLHPSTIEALACTQNWLWAAERTSSTEQTFLNEDDENEDGGKSVNLE